jgi:hypothetical protein
MYNHDQLFRAQVFKACCDALVPELKREHGCAIPFLILAAVLEKSTVHGVMK